MSNANDVQIRLMMTGMPTVISQLSNLTGELGKSRAALTRFNQGFHAAGSLLGSFSASSANSELHKVATQILAVNNAITQMATSFSSLAGARSTLLGLAGVAVIGTAVTGFNAFQAQRQEAKSLDDLAAANEKFADSLLKVIAARKAEGSLSAEKADALRFAVPNAFDRGLMGPVATSDALTGVARSLQSGSSRQREELERAKEQEFKRSQIANEATQARIASERRLSEGFYDAELISANEHFAKRKALATESYTAQLKALETEDARLLEKFSESTGEESTKILLQMEDVAGRRKKLEFDLQNEINQIQADARADWKRKEDEKERTRQQHHQAEMERIKQEAALISRQTAIDSGFATLENQRNPSFGGLDSERDIKIAGVIAQTEANAEAALAEGAHQEELTLIAQEGALKRLQIEVEAEQKKKALRDVQLMATQDMFNNMAIAAKAYGKEGFIAFKAFAIASATIETYKSAVAAYSATVGIPYVGPFIAPVAAAAAVAAGMANIAQISAQSYAVGGYTGDGGRFEPAGIVHRGEVVFSQDDVSRIGLGNLEALRSGDLEPASSGAVKVGIFDNRSGLRLFLESEEGRALILDTVGKQRGEV